MCIHTSERFGIPMCACTRERGCLGVVTIRREDFEVDGNGRDAFVGACDSIRFRLDLLPHLIEVHKLPTLTVQKFCILC